MRLTWLASRSVNLRVRVSDHAASNSACRMALVVAMPEQITDFLVLLSLDQALIWSAIMMEIHGFFALICVVPPKLGSQLVSGQ